MSSLRSFGKGYERAEVADLLMQYDAVEDVCPGYRRVSWSVAPLGALCVLGYYEKRNIYDAEVGSWVSINRPFYAMQFTFSQPNQPQKAVAHIDFNRDYAYIKRAEPHQFEQWDSIMATMDEAMRQRMDWLSKVHPLLQAAELPVSYVEHTFAGEVVG